MTAGQGNQSSALNAGEFNSSQGLTAQQDSFNNALASAGLTLNAAGQIVALNQAGLQDATTRAGLLSSVGDAQQQQQQAELTAAYNAYLQGEQMTVQQQQLLNSALGLIPNQGDDHTPPSSSSGSGTDTTKSPGLTDILGSVADLGKAIYGSAAAGSAGASGLMALATLSDERGKVRCSHIAAMMRRVAAGCRLRYNWEPHDVRHEGIIAQEILKSDPEAVHMPIR